MPVPVDVSVTLSSDDLDVERLDDTTRQLRSESLDLDVEHVIPARGANAPEGTRGLDALPDNAWAESFNGTLKNERAHHTQYPRQRIRQKGHHTLYRTAVQPDPALSTWLPNTERGRVRMARTK